MMIKITKSNRPSKLTCEEAEVTSIANFFLMDEPLCIFLSRFEAICF